MVVVITFLLRSWLLLSEAYSVHSNHCHDLGSRSALRENGADPCVHRRCGQEVDKATHALMAEAADDDDSSMRSVLATTDLNVLKRDYSAPTLEVKLGKMIEVSEPAIAALGRQCKVLFVADGTRLNGRARVTMYVGIGGERTLPDEQNEHADRMINWGSTTRQGAALCRRAGGSKTIWAEHSDRGERKRCGRQRLPRRQQRKASPTRRSARRISSTKTTASTSRFFPRDERPLPCPRADPEGCPIVRETPLKKERLHCGSFRYADGSVNSKTIGYAVRGDWEVRQCVLSGLGRMSAVRVGGAEMVGRRRNVLYVFG